MLKEMIGRIIERKNMTRGEAKDVMDVIMGGAATPAQIGCFLTAMRMKGETVEEITGFALSMRENATRITPDVPFLVDTCGTGGDGANTFNISTAAAFVASAAGIPVAKHGNRSVSSKSGSADVLEELGIVIDIPQQSVCRSIEEIGIGFMFAPRFHGAMKHAIGPRRELGIRTIFNLLGPLTNPASVQGQLMGVYSGELTEPMAEVLYNLGTERALVIHGLDGLDEISISAPTRVSELKNGSISTHIINPENFGYAKAGADSVKGTDPKANAAMILSVFRGEKGPRRDIVELNAGAAIYVGKGAETIAEGVRRAAMIIDSGKALKKLGELAEYTRACAEAV
jgi:anthranilate phosphoribosyltransferase